MSSLLMFNHRERVFHSFQRSKFGSIEKSSRRLERGKACGGRAAFLVKLIPTEQVISPVIYVRILCLP
jgi:hypothetical protein